MLSKKDINILGTVINDSSNNNITHNDAKKKINFILHNKSVKTVIKELKAYIDDIRGNEKNKVVLIVIMSLLRRNLDCTEELSLLIDNYNLTGCLYGGLKSLLSGNSEKFGLKIKLNTDCFENKYEYLTRFNEFYYWELIELFESVQTLSLVDIKKTERLAFDDQSNLILLNILAGHLNIKLSDNFVLKLLQYDDELKQNIGLMLLTENIVVAINDICETEQNKNNGFPKTKSLKYVKKTLNEDIKKCCALLDLCNKNTVAKLLFNYLLVHQAQYPFAFAKILMHSDLQEIFYKQIVEANKIKTIKDLYFLVNLISNTPALNNQKRRISKAKIYSAVTDTLIRFVEDDKGIYDWNEHQKWYMKEICRKLPSKNTNSLKTYLFKKRRTLMCARIDRLVRFEIYLKDKRKQDIIDGTINIIETCN